MKSKGRFFLTSLFTIVVAVLLLSCSENKNEEPGKNYPDEEYVSRLLFERASKDSSMQYDNHSPFKRDTNAVFSPLKYFEPTAEFIFKSKLFEYNPKDTVDVYGTRGELRRVIKEGYVSLMYNGEEYRVNVYKAISNSGQVYYSIWFTDRSTGNESYGVGRYLDFEKEDDAEHIYTIDFNRVYNPYCAYTPEYTCPIPREEDYIDIDIQAGEKNFH
jgi:uncharacterized protein (DUF1684 family)